MNPGYPVPVAVVLSSDSDPPEDEVEAMRILAQITGNWDKAYRLVQGTDSQSMNAWKGVLEAPVTYEAAEVIVRWVRANGMNALIAAGWYEGEDYDEVWADAASPEVPA